MDVNTQSLVEDRLLCPHCWFSFYRDQALYISKHPSLFGDTVLGPAVNRRFTPQEAKFNRQNEAHDSQGWRMEERACPRCHLQIPTDLLLKRPYILSIVGVPRSGKTYFLTSMIHHLRKELVNSFGLSLQDTDSHEVQMIMRYERELFYPADPNSPTLLHKTEEHGGAYNIARLEEIDVQLPKPFIFSLLPLDTHPAITRLNQLPQRNLVMYDNAGEAFDHLKERKGEIRVTQHLAECDAVLFTFDPLQCYNVRERLVQETNDPQITREAILSRQETILSETINRMRRMRNVDPRQQLGPALVVCVQKYDVWKSLLPHGEQNAIDHSSVEYVRRAGVSGLDVEEINNISLLVRQFLQDICPEFVALAEAAFRHVRYFPVSATGVSPEFDPTSPAGANMRVRPAQLQPFRVTHPLLWLLFRWKWISRTLRKGDNRAAEFPHAKVAPLGNGRIRVISPFSNKPLSLDAEYAGSVIIDPEAGQKFWIPAIAEPVNPPAQNIPPSVPKTIPNQQSTIQPLQLDQDAPPPPKRGWFRRS